MTSTDRAVRAAAFSRLHRAGDPLLLVNVWDVASAKTVLDSGAPALATSSGALAASQGFADGETMPLADLLRVVERIAGLSQAPLSVDLEAGYGRDPEAVARSVRQVVEAGAAGINLEDGLDQGRRALVDPIRQAERLAAARAASPALFINARIDTFLLGGAGPAVLSETQRRAEAYLAGGADGVFVPGLADLEAIGSLTRAITAPLNVMATRGFPTRQQLAAAGVSRISLGAWPMIAGLKRLRRRVARLADSGDFSAFE